jgi:hypothetical protein
MASRVSLDGGAVQYGGVTGTLGQEAQFSHDLMAGVVTEVWYLVASCTTFATPSGWAETTITIGVSPNTIDVPGWRYVGTTPPVVTLTPWGKWSIVLETTDNSGQITRDESLFVRVLSANDLEQIVPGETIAYGAGSWVAALNRNIQEFEYLSGAYAQVVRVAKDGGDTTTISSAIAAITDASASKRYVVLVYPGHYAEQVVMKDYVDVIGLSRHAVTLEYGSTGGAVQMANESLLENVLINLTSTASHWSIVVNNKTGWQIRSVDILGDMVAHTQIAQGIHVYGSSWQTGFVTDCIINYLGTDGWGLLVEGNSAAPQISDLHLERSFIDSYFATTGGCVKIKDCWSSLIDGGKFRTTTGGTALLLERTSTGTVDAGILGGAVFMAPGVANSHVVDLGANTALHHWDASCQSIRQAGNGSYISKYTESGAWRLLPSITSYSWVNQGSSTCVQNYDGHILLTQPKRTAADGPSVSMLVVSALTPPYDWIGRVWPCHSSKASIQSGMCWRQSSTGELVLVGLQTGYLFVCKYEYPTELSAYYFSQPWPVAGPIWLRLRETATDREVYVSPDGINWQGIHTVGRTDFLTADQVGIFVDANSDADPTMDAQLLVEHLALTAG